MADSEEKDCSFRQTCNFFNKSEDSSINRTLKNLYCSTGPQKCEIFRLESAGKSVPENMLPDGSLEF